VLFRGALWRLDLMSYPAANVSVMIGVSDLELEQQQLDKF